MKHLAKTFVALGCLLLALLLSGCVGMRADTFRTAQAHLDETNEAAPFATITEAARRAEIPPTVTELPPTATRTTAPRATVFESEGSGTAIPTRTRGPAPSATLFAPNGPIDIAVMDSFDNRLVEADHSHLIYTTDGFLEKFPEILDIGMEERGWTKVREGSQSTATSLRLEYAKENRTAVMEIVPAEEADRWLVTVTITEN